MTEVRPPDLEMRVRTASEHGGTRLSYTFHSPTGAVDFVHWEVAGPTLQSSPEEFQGRLLHKLEQLGQRLDVDGSRLLPEELDRKLVILGRDLWRQLLTPEIHRAYRKIRRSVRSWMIVSDEPWIPWELIKPYDDSGPEEIDDDFLALRFELTRWLAGDKTPAREIRVGRRAAFRTAADLTQSRRELDLMDGLAGPLQGVSDVSPDAGSAADLLAFLAGTEVEWLHFVGHGTYTSGQSEESGIPFPDGSILRPVDLEGPVATRVGRCRPLVFLNACWAGQQGWSLTRLGGWSSRWVSVCGCGALIAPMWPVRAKAALIFVRTFYESLAGGETLGQAALAARRRVYQERPGDASSLAYTVYGHPNARLRLGGSPSPEESVALAEAPLLYRVRRVRSRLWRRFPWIRPAAVACGTAVVLHLAAAPILDLFFPIYQPPSPQALPSVPANKPTPEKPEAGQAHEGRTTTNTTIGGLRFEIVGQSGLNYALKDALKNAAKSVSEEGVSGWTITLKIDQPRITQHAQDGFAMEACRLTAEASARGPDSRIDLGPINVVNSQFDSAQACEGAAGSLAEGVLDRFVTALATKGES